MKFWDTSAFVPLLIKEPDTTSMQKQLREDHDIILWWGSEIEATSALARAERADRISATELRDAQNRLRELVDASAVIAPTDRVRLRAQRLLLAHPLRAADSLQLAAALVACDEDPQDFGFVCRDERLSQAAIKEGFLVIS